MRFKYTEEHINYLRKIASGKNTYEITDLFNKKFNADLGRGAIKSCMSKHKINNGMDRNVARKMIVKSKYSDEQRKFIRNNIKGRLLDELLVMLNTKFKTNYKINQLRKYVVNNQLKSEVDCTFKKGLSFNPGVKYQFKKGNISPLYMPIGTEIITVNGYINVKVAEPNVWKRKHRLIWEKANGPVPEGYKVIFGDGNNRNFELSNLILVTNRQLLTLNRNKLIQNDAELTRTGLIIADIYHKIADLKKR